MLRGVLINGINVPSDRGDLQDRVLPIELTRIPKTAFQEEQQIWRRFAEVHPLLLGAVFDALSQTLRIKDQIRLRSRPRLADWGAYAAAVYEVLGWGTKAFLEDWDE